MYKKRGWKPFGTALIGGGAAISLVFFGSLKQYLSDGDYLSIIVLFAMCIIPIIAGILIIRWARKNGKK